MSSDMISLDINILGRAYQVSCKHEERESLLRAVQLVDGKMRELAEKTRGAGERLAVMTALTIAHELITLKSPNHIDEAELKRKIAAMQARIDKTLGEQEQLF